MTIEKCLVPRAWIVGELEHGGLIGGCLDSLDDTIEGYAYFEDLAKARGLDLYVHPKWNPLRRRRERLDPAVPREDDARRPDV